MQADTALDTLVQEEYPFLNFDGPANVLCAQPPPPTSLQAVGTIGGREMIGPILEGITFPVQIVARNVKFVT